MDKGRLIVPVRPTRELVRIGPDVTVRVLPRSSSGSVRLEVIAPKDVLVERVAADA
jgi:sRNA-binding carbon storage regulator CsrA